MLLKFTIYKTSGRIQERFVVSHSDLCFVRSHVYLNKEQTRETFVSQVCSLFCRSD